LRRKFWPWVN